jgi:CBS domain-containing protein
MATTTARDIMSTDTTCANENDSVGEAAATMARLGVGALPICGTDEQLKGMITDRDVAVRVVAADRDPSQVRVSELEQGEAVTIGADDTVEDILATMTEHGVRRLPVIDGNRLVGIVAQADVARALPDPQVGDLLDALSASS